MIRPRCTLWIPGVSVLGGFDLQTWSDNRTLGVYLTPPPSEGGRSKLDAFGFHLQSQFSVSQVIHWGDSNLSLRSPCFSRLWSSPRCISQPWNENFRRPQQAIACLRTWYLLATGAPLPSGFYRSPFSSAFVLENTTSNNRHLRT